MRRVRRGAKRDGRTAMIRRGRSGKPRTSAATGRSVDPAGVDVTAVGEPACLVGTRPRRRRRHPVFPGHPDLPRWLCLPTPGLPADAWWTTIPSGLATTVVTLDGNQRNRATQKHPAGSRPGPSAPKGVRTGWLTPPPTRDGITACCARHSSSRVATSISPG
ncbi:hypothetical protein FAGKG844_20217 [Frankia sp. AgKG'84/4]